MPQVVVSPENVSPSASAAPISLDPSYADILSEEDDPEDPYPVSGSLGAAIIPSGVASSSTFPTPEHLAAILPAITMLPPQRQASLGGHSAVAPPSFDCPAAGLSVIGHISHSATPSPYGTSRETPEADDHRDILGLQDVAIPCSPPHPDKHAHSSSREPTPMPTVRCTPTPRPPTPPMPNLDSVSLVDTSISPGTPPGVLPMLESKPLQRSESSAPFENTQFAHQRSSEGGSTSEETGNLRIHGQPLKERATSEPPSLKRKPVDALRPDGSPQRRRLAGNFDPVALDVLKRVEQNTHAWEAESIGTRQVISTRRTELSTLEARLSRDRSIIETLELELRTLTETSQLHNARLKKEFEQQRISVRQQVRDTTDQEIALLMAASREALTKASCEREIAQLQADEEMARSSLERLQTHLQEMRTQHSEALGQVVAGHDEPLGDVSSASSQEADVAELQVELADLENRYDSFQAEAQDERSQLALEIQTKRDALFEDKRRYTEGLKQQCQKQRAANMELFKEFGAFSDGSLIDDHTQARLKAMEDELQTVTRDLRIVNLPGPRADRVDMQFVIKELELEVARLESTHSSLQAVSNRGSDRDDLETNGSFAVDFRPAIFSANSDPASAFSFRPSGPSQPSLLGQSSTLQKGKNREIIPDATHGSSPRASVFSILPSSSAASRIPAPASTSRPSQSASNTSAVPSGSGYRPTRASGHGQEKGENRPTSPAGDSDDMDHDHPANPKQHTSVCNNGAGTSGGNASRGEGRAYPIPSHEGGKGKTYVSKSSNRSTLRTSKRKDDRKTVLKDIYHRVVKEMLGLTALKDAYLLTSAHPDQVRRFNRGDRDAGGPDSDNLLFDWTATLKSDWNQEAQWKISMRVQQLSSDIDLEVSPPEINKYLSDMLTRAKATWAQHRTKKKNDGTLESPAEAEARISAETELMSQQNRANSRRTNRYDRRMDIAEAMIKIAQRVGNQGDEEGWTWLRQLLRELKAQGMSSDESDAGGAFVVRRLPWRVVTSHHMDFIESRRKQSGICGPRARSPEPRIRREDAPDSKRGAPIGLARCLYDPAWLADQLDSRRAQLKIPESDDEGFQFIELGYNR